MGIAAAASLVYPPKVRGSAEKESPPGRRAKWALNAERLVEPATPKGDLKEHTGRPRECYGCGTDVVIKGMLPNLSIRQIASARRPQLYA